MGGLLKNTQIHTNMNTDKHKLFLCFLRKSTMIYLCGFVFLSALICVPSAAKATGGASLYFSPNQGTFYVGSTFNVSIFVNTGGNDINTIKVDLKFDPKKLQIVSPTIGKSFITIWVSQPTYSNIKGAVTFQGGIPHPGINTSSGLVSTITFRARSPGETTISFLSSSKVLLDDGKGTDILTSLSKGEYDLIIPPPAGPKISSSTHPDQNRWYKDNNPALSWQKEENISGFSWNLGNNSEEAPDSKIDGTQTFASYQDLDNGIWFFNLKAKSKDLWGGTSHYILQIDSAPPASFIPSVEPRGKSPEKRRIVSFLTSDSHSGIDHYEVKVVEIKGSAEKEAAFFIEKTSPWHMPELSPDKYQIIVRAYDKAGNYRDAIQEIEITPPFLSPITREGMRIKGVLFSWWTVSGVVLILFTILGIILYLWWRKHKDLSDELERHIQETEERLKKERGELNRQLQEEREVKEALEKGIRRMVDTEDKKQ